VFVIETKNLTYFSFAFSTKCGRFEIWSCISIQSRITSFES